MIFYLKYVNIIISKGDEEMKNKLKIKLLRAMRDGYISYEEAINILIIKNKKQLTYLMNAINELYNEDKIMPVTLGQEKGLVLCKK